METKILSDLGLTNWEAKTYLSLLELGSTTTGPLVKKCNVPQSKIYSVLSSLHNKGLASFIVKGKTKYFQAANPETLLSIIKEKERKVKETIPLLKELTIKSKNKQSVEIYEGMKSVTSLFIDLIENSKKGDEWLSFSIGEDELLEKTQTFWNKIGAFRAEKGLNVKTMDNIKYEKELKKIYPERWKYIRKIMRFSKSIFPATTVIFQNKVIILNFLSDTETAVVITSKDMFEFYKNFYLQEWNKVKI